MRAFTSTGKRRRELIPFVTNRVKRMGLNESLDPRDVVVIASFDIRYGDQWTGPTNLIRQGVDHQTTLGFSVQPTAALGYPINALTTCFPHTRLSQGVKSNPQQVWAPTDSSIVLCRSVLTLGGIWYSLRGWGLESLVPYQCISTSVGTPHCNPLSSCFSTNAGRKASGTVRTS